jgi:hypothetical protein
MFKVISYVQLYKRSLSKFVSPCFVGNYASILFLNGGTLKNNTNAYLEQKNIYVALGMKINHVFV